MGQLFSCDCQDPHASSMFTCSCLNKNISNSIPSNKVENPIENIPVDSKNNENNLDTNYKLEDEDKGPISPLAKGSIIEKNSELKFSEQPPVFGSNKKDEENNFQIIGSNNVNCS